MKAMVHSLDSDTDFFDIVTGVLQRNTLVLFLFIISWDFVLWMSRFYEKNDLTLKMARSRRYPAETTTDADDLVLLANVSA